MTRVSNILRAGIHGYLLEVPLILTGTCILLAVLLPRLSTGWAAILTSAGTVVVLPCLYYMIVTPGWQPGRVSRSLAARIVMFTIAAGAILTVAGAMILRALR